MTTITFNFLKTQIKYSTILIAFIIFTAQIYIFVNEISKDVKESTSIDNYNNEVDIKGNTGYINTGIQTEEEICKESGFGNLYLILQLLFKCSLAFLAGGLLTDAKFIKIGIF